MGVRVSGMGDMNFVFLESKPRRFSARVTVQMPRQSGPVPQTFHAEMIELEQSDLDHIAAKPDADMVLIRKKLVGWAGIQNVNGDEMPFSEELRDRLMARPYVRYAIARACVERPPGDVCIWPDNASAARLFVACATQWQFGWAGDVLDLDYTGVRTAADLMQIDATPDLGSSPLARGTR